jgi:hypothetical protein
MNPTIRLYGTEGGPELHQSQRGSTAAPSLSRLSPSRPLRNPPEYGAGGQVCEQVGSCLAQVSTRSSHEESGAQQNVASPPVVLELSSYPGVSIRHRVSIREPLEGLGHEIR